MFPRPSTFLFSRLLRAVFILVSGFLGAAPVFAESSLEEVVRLAFQNNRELRIAALEINRARATARWSGRLDNPELEVTFSDDEAGLDENEGTLAVAFSQRFPLTSRLRQEKSLRAWQVILAEAELAERKRELAYQVDLALVEWLATRTQRENAREQAALNGEILAFLTKQAAAGEVSKLVVIQTKLTGQSISQQASLADASEKTALLHLKQLIGLEPGTGFVPPAGLSRPGGHAAGEREFTEVLNRRPDHVLALSRIDEAEAEAAFAHAKRWEDISVQAFAERERAVDEPGGLERNTFLGIGVSIPLPLRQRNQEGIAQANIQREEAARELEAVQFRIRSELAEAYQQSRDAWSLAREIGGEVMDLAEQNLAEFRQAYAQGQASLVEVQRAQEQILELRKASLDALASWHRAEAKVRYVTGAYPGLSLPSDAAK
jgi:outer membrane protein, heavy metal efflux system